MSRKTPDPFNEFGSRGAARLKKAVPLTFASKGRRSSSNTPRSAWAATRPSTSTRFTAIQRTITE